MSPRQHIGEKAAIVSSVREARKMILLRKTIQTGSCERTDLNKRFFRHDMLSWSFLADEGRSASLPITLCGVTMREVLITLAAKRNHTGGVNSNLLATRGKLACFAGIHPSCIPSFSTSNGERPLSIDWRSVGRGSGSARLLSLTASERGCDG